MRNRYREVYPFVRQTTPRSAGTLRIGFYSVEIDVLNIDGILPQPLYLVNRKYLYFVPSLLLAKNFPYILIIHIPLCGCLTIFTDQPKFYGAMAVPAVKRRL